MKHLSQPVLQSFVHGDLSTEQAVECAAHLDDCPDCATRWALAEPLSLAFAAVDDPVVPPDLEGVILARLKQPPTLMDEPPITELLLSAALLGLAVVVLVTLADPLGLLLDAAALAKGGFIASSALLPW